MGWQSVAVRNGAQSYGANTDIEVKRCTLALKRCNPHRRELAESPDGTLDF